MPDSIVLRGPLSPSPIQLGSYLMADPGPDYGSADLQQRLITSNPMTVGGRLAYESFGPRAFNLPLRLASGGLSLPALESLVRFNARSGGYVDIQPLNVASSEAVRFDVLSGRWEPDYDLHMNRHSRRMGWLRLDVQPFGYWPTWITLVASAGQPAPFTQAFTASFGDAPFKPARLVIDPPLLPTAMPSGPPGGPDPPDPWICDYVSWAIHPTFNADLARPSYSGLLIPATKFSVAGILAGGANAASLIADAFASQMSPSVLTTAQLPGGSALSPQLIAVIGHDLLPDSGRFRVYAWAKLGPSGPPPGRLAAAVLDQSFGGWGGGPGVAGVLPTYSAVATVIPECFPVASSFNNPSSGTWGSLASNAYGFYDLGVVSMPDAGAIPSEFGGGTYSQVSPLWLFFGRGSWSTGNPTSVIKVAGVYLHPLDGPNGIMPKGLAFPTSGYGAAGAPANGIELIGHPSYQPAMYQTPMEIPDVAFGSTFPRGNPVHSGYTGDLPYIRASDSFLSVNIAYRKGSMKPDPMVLAISPMSVNYKLQYRPTFTFLKGL